MYETSLIIEVIQIKGDLSLPASTPTPPTPASTSLVGLKTNKTVGPFEVKLEIYARWGQCQFSDAASGTKL